MGNLIYGRATFYDKLLTDIYLEDEDFEQYGFDEETDTYHFEGEIYESDYEILKPCWNEKSKSATLKSTAMEIVTIIATKFVRHDVPELATLQNAKVYLLREKLNKGEKLNRQKKKLAWQKQ